MGDIGPNPRRVEVIPATPPVRRPAPTTAPAWPSELAKRLGDSISEARKARDMTAVKLAEETESIGVPIHRVAITRIEKGEQVITVPELITLGVALDTDWTRWLIKAAEGLSIKGERRREELRAMLADLSQQVSGLEFYVDRAREMHGRSSTPELLRQKIEGQIDRYLEMIASLHSDQLVILELLNEIPHGA